MLMVSCAVQNRRMDQEDKERRELKISNQFLTWQRGPPQLPWAAIKACCTCHRPLCVLAFYRDCALILAAATLTAARTVKVAWMQSCRRTLGTAEHTDRRTHKLEYTQVYLQATQGDTMLALQTGKTFSVLGSFHSRVQLSSPVVESS